MKAAIVLVLFFPAAQVGDSGCNCGSHEENDMARWRVSGAGDDSYNGVYTDAGAYGDERYYTNDDGDRYLYYVPGGLPAWYLGDALPMTPSAYLGVYDEDLPANPWSVGFGGVAPAPTLAEVFRVRGRLVDRTQRVRLVDRTQKVRLASRSD